MNFSYLLFISFLFTLSISAKTYGQGTDHIKTTKLRINPDYARGGVVSDIFDSIRYIPLETTKESTFGLISNLQISTHYFVFNDINTKSIFVFNKQGKFVSKISTVPQMMPETKFMFSDFVLNPFNEKIYFPYYRKIDNRRSSKISIAIINPTGSVQEVIDLDTTLEKSINYSSFSFIDSNTAIFSTESRDTSVHHYFYEVKNFKQITRKIAPILSTDPFVDYSKNYQNASRTMGYTIWQRNTDYDYLLSEGGDFSKYRFIFPKRLSLDSAVYFDTAMMKNGQLLARYIEVMHDKITSIDHLLKMDNNLSFTLAKGNSNTSHDVFLYGLSSGTLFCLGIVQPDATNGYLPFIDTDISEADKDYIYAAVPAYALFEAKENTAAKHPVYDGQMRQFFATETRKSNPVIVQLKLKKRL